MTSSNRRNRSPHTIRRVVRAGAAFGLGVVALGAASAGAWTAAAVYAAAIPAFWLWIGRLGAGDE